jgi:hypothetical protein
MGRIGRANATASRTTRGARNAGHQPARMALYNIHHTACTYLRPRPRVLAADVEREDGVDEHRLAERQEQLAQLAYNIHHTTYNLQHTTYAWHAAWTHNWHTPYNIQDTTWTRIGLAHGTGYSAVGTHRDAKARHLPHDVRSSAFANAASGARVRGEVGGLRTAAGMMQMKASTLLSLSKFCSKKCRRSHAEPLPSGGHSPIALYLPRSRRAEIHMVTDRRCHDRLMRHSLAQAPPRAHQNCTKHGFWTRTRLARSIRRSGVQGRPGSPHRSLCGTHGTSQRPCSGLARRCYGRRNWAAGMGWNCRAVYTAACGHAACNMQQPDLSRPLRVQQPCVPHNDL